MRYLALDVGNKRVGVAVGSREGRIATPLAVIVRSTLERDTVALRAIVREYEVEALVVGLPRNENGTVSAQETLTRNYVKQIETELALPIIFRDERFSTAVALDHQRARGVNEKRGRATLDANAAAVILQDFLNSQETQDSRLEVRDP